MGIGRRVMRRPSKRTSSKRAVNYSMRKIRTIIIQARATADPRKALLAKRLTAAKLKSYGLSAKMLRDLRFSLQELIILDYPPLELVEAGYPAGEVWSAINSLANLRRLGKKALKKK